MSFDNGKSSSSGIFMALMAGLAIGTVFGILFAPRSGKDTRNDLVEKGERLMELGKESVSDVVEKTKDLAESGKRKFEEIKDAVK